MTCRATDRVSVAASDAMTTAATSAVGDDRTFTAIVDPDGWRLRLRDD